MTKRKFISKRRLTFQFQIVIKYVPYVGDSKRAMDEYTSEILMGGHNTIAVHNTCEDSLLASPIILDLVILAELSQRITFKVGDSGMYTASYIESMTCLLYTSPSPRDRQKSRMPSSA